MVVWHGSMRRAVPAAALVLLLAGCAGGTGGTGARGGGSLGAGTPSPSGTAAASPAPATSDAAGCNGAAAGGQSVRFGPAGATTLVGVVFGTGRTGLVFAHQNRANRCQWAAYAREAAAAGYRAMTFDAPGFGDSPAGLAGDAAVIAAVSFLRGQGVRTVTLVGASMGGTAVLTAAPRIDPPVAGVISLSGPAFFQGMDAGAAVKGLAVPVLYAACKDDDGFADDAASLDAATPAGHPHRLLVVPGCSRHGVELADPAGGPEAASVRTAIRDFLATYAPA
jgi:pimeloyl-ACP methyl ester carboxylesterase